MCVQRKLFAATIAASMFASGCGNAASAKEKGTIPDITPKPNADGNYNIVFITTDQEQYFSEFPSGTAYEARKLLAELGTTFEKHYNCATMSTSSRSVIYTGKHITDTLMIDNTDFDWQGPLSENMTTIGDMMRSAGYYTAYKGKWHMANASTISDVEDELTDLGEYGFADWNVSGDYIGKMWEGYEKDPEIVSHAVEWLQGTGVAKNAEGKSFFLAVNLVNPHDIMYFNDDETWVGPIPVGTAPDAEVYKKTYGAALPSSWTQDVSDDRLPDALAIFKRFMAKQTGPISTEASWKSFQDYYWNCIQDSDNNLMVILQKLIDLGMLDKTIIVFTADHGDMGSAHGLKGKGGFLYEQNTHVPLYIVHPECEGRRSVKSVTSHIDLATTFVRMANISEERKASITAGLPGKDLMELVRGTAQSVRDAALFCAELISTTMAKANTDAAGNIVYYSFNTDIRGFVRAIMTERYKFARYFSLDFNTPATMEELLTKNDIELYDLENDPQEMNNLAADPVANEALILDMNARLNALIAAEIGTDDGSEASTVINAYNAEHQIPKTGSCNAGMHPVAGFFVLLPLLALATGIRRRK